MKNLIGILTFMILLSTCASHNKESSDSGIICVLLKSSVLVLNLKNEMDFSLEHFRAEFGAKKLDTMIEASNLNVNLFKHTGDKNKLKKQLTQKGLHCIIAWEDCKELSSVDVNFVLGDPMTKFDSSLDFKINGYNFNLQESYEKSKLLVFDKQIFCSGIINQRFCELNINDEIFLTFGLVQAVKIENTDQNPIGVDWTFEPWILGKKT